MYLEISSNARNLLEAIPPCNRKIRESPRMGLHLFSHSHLGTIQTFQLTTMYLLDCGTVRGTSENLEERGQSVRGSFPLSVILLRNSRGFSTPPSLPLQLHPPTHPAALLQPRRPDKAAEHSLAKVRCHAPCDRLKSLFMQAEHGSILLQEVTSQRCCCCCQNTGHVCESSAGTVSALYLYREISIQEPKAKKDVDPSEPQFCRLEIQSATLYENSNLV